MSIAIGRPSPGSGSAQRRPGLRRGLSAVLSAVVLIAALGLSAALISQRVRDQDKPVIESQRPALVPPLSAGISLAMAPADAPLIEYLRWLEELNLTVTPDS